MLHLAVNSRLTRFLKADFMAKQLAEDHSKVVQTPQVMTWSQWWHAWQDSLMLQGKLPLNALPEKVLTTFEAQSIWQSLLEEACQQDGLLLMNTSQTARQLYQAWNYDHEYLSHDTHFQQTIDEKADLFEGLYQTEETRLYLKLKKRYLRLLQQRNLWDAALQMQHRLSWFESFGSIGIQVKLHGFDDLSPYFKTWIAMVEAKGGNVVSQQQTSQSGEQKRLIAKDETDEVQQAALWAYEQAKTLKETLKSRTPRIAIVAPDIATVAQPLAWALDECLLLNQGVPLKFQQDKSAPSAFYNISLGQVLTDLPIVQNALSILTFSVSSELNGDAAKIDYNHISEWLMSPYTPGDLVSRQTLDFGLRSWQWPRLTLVELYKALQRQIYSTGETGDKKSAQQSCLMVPKPLLKSLKAMTQPGRFSSVESGKKRLSAEAFYQAAISVLEQAGWAESGAQGALNSVEFQQKQAFLKALHGFSNQSIVSLTGKQDSQLSAQAWLQKLRQYVVEQVHQPEAVADAPIQIMGMLEAGGQTFDALWVMGLTASAWPREAKPNPFLPMQLQREYQLPRADVARELHYAQALTQRLLHSAPEVVWSFPKQSEGQLNLSSRVIEKQLEGMGVMTLLPLSYQSISQVLFNQALPIEKIQDDQAPAVPEGQKVPGGSAILNAQNQCPLMAFFDYRLGAKYQLESVEDGLKSNHLGTLVHQVLEDFWRETKTQAALLRLSDEQVKFQVEILLDHYLAEVAQHFNHHYLSSEKQRITGLLCDWLALEAKRPPFEVLAFEQSVELNLAGIRLSITIDRIDGLAPDQIEQPVLVLDYKTGKTSINDLLKTPIQAPQLALYLHALQGELPWQLKDLQGLGYGKIHSDEGVSFSVVVSESGYQLQPRLPVFEKLPGKLAETYENVSWQAYLESLKTFVEQLAEAVQQGQAGLIYDKPDAIRYAASQLALRLPEALANTNRYLVDTE